MKQLKRKTHLFILTAFLPCLLQAQTVKILVNHIGYEVARPKNAIILAPGKEAINMFDLIDMQTGQSVFTGKPVYRGVVDHWKNRQFWTLDFSGFLRPGNYKLMIHPGGKVISSYPFSIGDNILEKATLSDIAYYFKGQRSSGLLDKADHHLILAGKSADTIDAHGGWYDATGDYGKHLSHLSFSSYFNPQQIAFTDWSLFKTYEFLKSKPGTDYQQVNRRFLDEAVYGADYLVRVHVKGQSFYRSVSAPGPGKLPGDRNIQAEESSYRIKQTREQSFIKAGAVKDWRSYQSSYRSGGGMAIAALALASTFKVSGDHTCSEYLNAAENAFAFLEKENVSMDFDHNENILDDYCALMAATELFKATHNEYYRSAASIRARQLIVRLSSWKTYHNYFRADEKDRPFFHPSDAGLPVVSLLTFFPYAGVDLQSGIKEAVRKSMVYELSVSEEVNNPFGYSRQLVQDTSGNRYSSFFFPHDSDASPWWQGENARLASVATAAKMAAFLFKDEKPFHNQLEHFSLNQLNWILGLNPFNSCMLQGKGYNNPSYGFFGTSEYTNAPGGIVNGITSGLVDERDIDFNLSYALTGKDYDWRWAEQWLPHASWFALAVSFHE